MAKITEYEEYYICDICGRKTNKNDINRFKRCFWILNDKFSCKFDICDICLEEIKLRTKCNKNKE